MANHSGIELLTIKEAASCMGVHPNTVRGLVRSGRLAAIRVGDKLVRIKPDAVKAFLSSCPAVVAVRRKAAPGLVGLDDVDPDTLLNGHQAAALGGITEEGVRKARERGNIKGTKDGRYWYYKASDVREWLAYRAANGLGK